MTLRRALIRAFDRPGGRAILSAVVTRMARRRAPGVRAYFHRGMWVHREGDVIFVDSPQLDYHPSIFCAWANELDRSLEEAADHWMHVYKPAAGDTVIDIGAGKGEDTIAFSIAVGPAGRVIAIEAHPATFRCLRLFCEWNRLGNVSAIHCAITGRSGPVTMESASDWQSNRIASNGVTVPGLTLDEVVQRENLTRIDLLKMNIEGGEAEAMRGMDRTLGITRALCVSCHDFRDFRTKAIVQDAVERAGFRMVPRDGDPRPYVADQINAVSLLHLNGHNMLPARQEDSIRPGWFGRHLRSVDFHVQRFAIQHGARAGGALVG